MKRFRGVSQLSLDAKGRMVFPARYRETLSEICQNQLVVTVDTDQPCLLIYPVNEWDIIQDQIDALPSFNKVTRKIQRLIVGYADDVSVDANGRLLLPTAHRQFAGLGKKILLIGQGKKFELWDEQTWNEKRDEWLEEDDDGELPDALGGLSL
ncbi:MAG: division/cell wall cluster transcriptional repressor MraZ [Gammaproteobacteria bacterium]|nr:division/cell wall cluster transcriptional repressor MraZ [Gammaproteobacteria bacterium]